MSLSIQSDKNDRIKEVVRLKKKKYRDQQGLFLIEGANLVTEALQQGWEAEYFLVSDGGHMSDLREMLDQAVPERTFVVPERLMEKVSDAQNGAGVVGVIRKPVWDLNWFVSSGEGLRNVLVLDRIQDPGNLGTMVRTAAAAGYAGIIALKGTADVFSLKVLRSTAGMIFQIPFFTVDSEDEVLDAVRKSGRRLVVTDPRRGVPYYDADLKRGAALVIGNEGRGISPSLMDMADVRVTIPMADGVESLNAGISAAILMYEAVRG